MPDSDGDGDVDGVDFSEFASCFNKAGNPPRTFGCPSPILFDSDFDNDIDGVDFSVFAACFNQAGHPPRCDDDSVLYNVCNAEELTSALGSAQSGDVIQVICPRIDMGGNYVIPEGVILTSDGTRENRMVTGNINYPSWSVIKPIDIRISKLTIGGNITLHDPENALVEDCYIDGDVDDTGVRPDLNAFWILTYDSPVISATVRRCEPKNFERDGFSISHNGGGAQSDASGATLYVEDCYVDEASNMGLDFNDQPLTTHSYGRLIVNGGRYGPTPATGMVASGSPYSPIEVYDATFVGGYLEANIAERCTVIDGSAKLHTWGGEGHMYDTVFDNAPVIEIWNDGFEIKRCFIRGEDWDSPTPSTTTGLNIKNGASVAIESSVLIGNPRASNGASRAVVGGGTDDGSRSVSITNCLFHNWGYVFNVSSSRFYNCELYNNVFLGNANLVTALSSSITSGMANYYDGTGSSSIPGGTKFPNGNGASAYDMLDYLNDDFHPVGPSNFIKGLGAPHAEPVADLDGNWFEQASPDVGPYRVPD